jgi:hypothetical protein
MLDIVFCSLPYSNLDHIYSAPAILKGVAVANGFSSKTIDFGCELLNQCDKDTDKFYRLQVYFISLGQGDESFKQEIDTFYENCLDYFRNNPSKYIGLSVLSIHTHRAVFELCTLIKAAGIDSQIVIGGRGAKVPAFSTVAAHFNLRGQEKLSSFGDLLRNRGLADHVIIGDGEDAILELLQRDQLTDSVYVSEEFKSPVPDYTDYNFQDYLFAEEPMLPVTGSKGCVRDCDFCDIKFQFGKYRYRSGTDVANELIAVSSQFGIRKFQFTDSLVNGGLKPFREFLEVLSRYNLENPDKRITWNGQYISRPYNEIPQDLYRLMRDSGAHGLTIGAESGSNRVLKAMNKKTTVEALLLELENFRNHDITCVLLTFVGHWSETWEDFVDHCRMFVRIAPYVRSGTISAVSLGIPYVLLDGTPSMFNHEINNISIAENKNLLWINRDNLDNNLKERLYRRLLVQQICKKLNIPTISDKENLLYLTDAVKHSYQEINDFFEKFSRESVPN